MNPVSASWFESKTRRLTETVEATGEAGGGGWGSTARVLRLELLCLCRFDVCVDLRGLGS